MYLIQTFINIYVRTNEQMNGWIDNETNSLFTLYNLLCTGEKDSSNLYFAFRWLLVDFKREFHFPDLMSLWEVGVVSQY